MVKISDKVIQEALHNSLKKFLTEELGIADIVNKETNNICSTILEMSKTVSPVKENEYTKRSGQFNAALFGELDVTVYFTYFNFKTINDFEKNFDVLDLAGYSSYLEKMIRINFFAISGEIDDRSLYDQCQHEISHLYMAFRKKNVLLSNRRRNEYDLAVRMMNSNANGGFDKMFGKILYMSFEEEQNAFVNGAYRLMVANFKTEQPYSMYVQSDAYRFLKELKYYQMIINSNNFDEEDMANMSNSLKNLNYKDFEWFKKQLDIDIYNFEKKLFRMFYKAKKEYNEYMQKIIK